MTIIVARWVLTNTNPITKIFVGSGAGDIWTTFSPAEAKKFNSVKLALAYLAENLQLEGKFAPLPLLFTMDLKLSINPPKEGFYAS